MTTTQDWGDLSLMSLFKIETETQVDALNQNLLNLEKSGWRDPSSLAALMRAAHSIKGAARIVQLEAAVKVAHALEDCFIAAQQNVLTLTAAHVDTLLVGVDLLSQLGSMEESTMAEKMPACEAEVDAVVLAIETLVTEAEQQVAVPQVSTLVEVEEVEVEEVEVEEIKVENVEIEAVEIEEIAVTPQTQPSMSVLEPSAAVPVLEPSAVDAADESSRMVRISAENLNRLMGLAGESLVEANWLEPFSQSLLQLKRQQQAVIALLEKQADNNGVADQDTGVAQALQSMQKCHTLLSDQLTDLDLFSRRFGQLSDRLYREVIASHMCSFSEGARGYGRLVRDLARQLGKQVSFEIVGLNTQVDRDILTRLDTPITHLLTNAVVHGIETPAVRLANGKPAEGKICLRAMHRSGMLMVSVEDDGVGVSYGALRQQVVQKGLVVSDVATRLSEAELLEFLFLPGFSTASQVDKVAGRGYGLDLVRTMAQSVGGSLQAISPMVEGGSADGTARVGGTRFQFQLPLTLSVVRSLLFEVANEPYAISLSRIARVIKLRREHICYSENKPYFNLRDRQQEQNDAADTLDKENISLVAAQQILALSNPVESSDLLSVIVIGEPGNRYGICVDRLLEERDLVVRPLDSRLGKVPNISAAALTEKGAPILIVDVADMLRSAEKLSTGEVSAVSSIESECASGTADSSSVLSQGVLTKPAAKRVLVVDDSMTVRAMEKKLLQNKGYAVDIAVDGAEGWNLVRANTYDLVITDVDMPRMSGIELIGQMKANEATKKLPVIVVSYKDRAEDQLAGLNAGANYYLTKSSFHDDGLINAVIDLIG